MPPPTDWPIYGVWVSTGLQRHRIGWRGAMILQIQERRRTGHRRYPHQPDQWTGTETRWRDARWDDLCPTTQQPGG